METFRGLSTRFSDETAEALLRSVIRIVAYSVAIAVEQ